MNINKNSFLNKILIIYFKISSGSKLKNHIIFISFNQSLLDSIEVFLVF